MHVDSLIIDSAATLIGESLGLLPVTDEVEWRRFDAADAATLRALLDELSHDDLCGALRCAADRLAVDDA